MDINTVIQLINGVGFPITACIAMAAFIVWDKKNRQAAAKDNMNALNEMYMKVRESVDNNTKMIEQLLEKLDGGK